MDIERLAKIAVDCGFKLHKELGPGLLESVYELLLAESLRERGLGVERQRPVPIRHGSIVIDNAFKVDLLVEGLLVIELRLRTH